MKINLVNKLAIIYFQANKKYIEILYIKSNNILFTKINKQ